MTKSFVRGEEGAAALEFALVLPAFLAFIWLIIEIGNLLWAMTSVNFAVAEAARCAAVGGSACHDNNGNIIPGNVVNDAVARSMGFLTPADVVYPSNNPACPSMQGVSATYVFQPFPWVARAAVNFGFQACHA